MIAAIAALRPAVRRRAIVVLLPTFVTTALVCWGFEGFLPNGIPFSLVLMQWQPLVLIPVIGVITCFTGLRLYERLLRRREPEKAG
jgi:Trk-type K+ transport system membrane component